MNRKPFAIALLWIVVTWVAVRLVGSPLVLLDPPVLAFVLVIPALSALTCVGPRGMGQALGDAFSGKSEDLPLERRLASASTLRSMGSAAIAAGLIGFLGVVVATFNTIASTGGQASPMEFVGALPGMILGPLYGLALKGFLFDVLADGLEGDDSGLGNELDSVEEGARS